jgi:type II secretory ATPase GspE/PulE/Tfp pilus assembly ATPase PilB-like protein
MELSAEHVDLSSFEFTSELVETVPTRVARTYQVLPIYETVDTLCIAISYPAALDTMDTVQHHLNRPVEFRYADADQLRMLIERLYPEPA